MTRRLGFEYNGMVLHEYYFGNLARGRDMPPAARRCARRSLSSFGTASMGRTDFQAVGRHARHRLGHLFQDPATDPSNHWITLHEDGSRRLQAAPRHGRLGARVHPRLQGDGPPEVRRGLLQEHRLAGRRAPAPRGVGVCGPPPEFARYTTSPPSVTVSSRRHRDEGAALQAFESGLFASLTRVIDGGPVRHETCPR